MRMRRRQGPEGKGTGERAQSDRGLVERLEELGDLALAALASSFTFYLDLAPDGRELDSSETAAVRERLLVGARVGRTLDAERDMLAFFAQTGGFDLRPTLAALRLLQHSLVLALSEDPERRARAMSVPQLQEHVRPVYEQWQEVRGKK